MIGAPFDIASNQLEFLKAIGLYLSSLKVYFNMSLQQYKSPKTYQYICEKLICTTIWMLGFLIAYILFFVLWITVV